MKMTSVFLALALAFAASFPALGKPEHHKSERHKSERHKSERHKSDTAKQDSSVGAPKVAPLVRPRLGPRTMHEGNP